MNQLPLMQRSLAQADPDIAAAIANERRRQADGLELIASENFVSSAVLEAAGSVMTNKYAEGYPGKRYYGGCEFVDVAETLAIARAKSLFGAEHANVQPHSGAQANMSAYLTLLKPGDTVLGMNLAHGGHLTHGHPLNFSGKLYTIVPYGVRKDDERLDYDEFTRLAQQHKPKMIIAGASAYSRVFDFPRMAEVARAVGAPLMVDMAHIAGLVAGGQHPSPVPHADFVTTTTHKTLRGPRGGMVLCREQYAKDLDRTVFPGIQGGPLMHVIAAKAVCFREAATPEFAAYQKQIVKNAARARRRVDHRGLPHRQRRHRQSHRAGGRVLEGPHRKSGGGGARPGRHHRQQERDSLRSESADGGERHSPRHAGRDHARHGRSRDGSDRRVHHARDGDARRRRRAGDGQGRSRTVVPQVPAVPGTPGLSAAVDAAFADEGPLARAVDQFEPREGQRAMAAAVGQTLQHGGVLLAEAGTGTGKTLAYLVPAILNRQRVLISTGTKNLQEQIYFKDIPALQTALGVTFKAAYMKGRANYLCLHRLDQLRAAPHAAPDFISMMDEWRRVTESGDRAELSDLPEDSSLWHDVSATAETCLGTDCPQYRECYVTKMRQRAAESDLVIVNHHLLCADASVRQSSYGEVIPDCHYAVIDEAHQLEDVATQYFGIAVSNYRIADLVRDAERALNLGAIEDDGSELRHEIAHLDDHSHAFFGSLAMARHARPSTQGGTRGPTLRSGQAAARNGCASGRTGSATSSITAWRWSRRSTRSRRR